VARAMKRRRRCLARVAATALCGVIAACGSPAVKPRPLATSVGVASWYGPGFHGRPTSSGEIFDQNAMTAAHPSWPLGTPVRVTNLDNGRVTRVRINDRGPFIAGRDIDLSYAAARELGMIGAGTCNVRLEPILGAGEALAVVQFAVQVAAFQDETRARDYRQRLARAAFSHDGAPPVYVVPTPSPAGDVYRVRVGPYPERARAEASAARLASAGLTAIVVEETRSFR
jgi:rare lipoprotein A